MKIKYYIFCGLLIILFSGMDLFGGDFPVDTIYYSGPKANRINFVFLSDGYQQHELDKYITDVKKSVDYFFKIVPLSNYKNYFNVWAVRVPSKESGASHPRTAPDCPDSASHPKLVVDNYFGSRFDGSGVHRALIITRADSAINVLKRNFPDYDQAFVLVNTPFYGGTGGTFPTSSIASSASEIILHEFTHSFARLADEYGGNCTYKSLIGPNVTNKKDISQIPWNNWISDTVPVPTPSDSRYKALPGLFQGAYYCDTGWYRPQLNCKMRSLGQPYCVVCTQVMIERIHKLVNPVDSYYPIDTYIEATDTIINFKVDVIKTIPYTIETLWYIDSSIVSDKDSLRINTAELPEGYSGITVLVNDTTLMTRDTAHINNNIHKQIVHWEILKSTTGVTFDGSLIDMNINIFPNPVKNEINISINQDKACVMQAEIADINGNTVFSSSNLQISAGESNTRLDLSGLKIATGTYYLVLKIDKTILSKQLIFLQ